MSGIAITLLFGVLAVFASIPVLAQVVQLDPVVVQGRNNADGTPGVSCVAFIATSAAALPSIQNLAGRVPNLGAADGRSSSYGDLIGLRGVSNTPFFTDPSVGVYLDDLPLASTFAFPVGLFGYESATVYRGPQGTRFGRSGEGGVIILSSPSWDRVGAGQIEAGLGDHGLRRALFSVRGRSVEGSLWGYADAAHFERDGYVENRTTSRRVDDVDQDYFRAGARWQAGEASTFTFRLLGGSSRNGAQPLVPLGGPLDSVTRVGDGVIRTDSLGASLKGEIAFAGGRLTSVTGLTDWQLDPYTNVLEIGISLDSEIHQRQRLWSQSLAWSASPTDTLDWNLGAFVGLMDTRGSISRGLTGLFLIEASGFEIDADTVAVFGEVTWRLGDRLAILTGLRLERTRKAFNRTENVPGTARYDDGQSFNSAQPRLQFDHTIAPQTRLLATLAVGEKPGGWSSFTGNRDLARFDAERLISVELGLRTANADQTLQAAATVFYYSISDYQIERSFSQTDYLVVNAPRARSVGGELELDWRPTAEWHFTVTAGLTEMTLREFTDPYDGRSYSGNRAPYTPAYTVALGVIWQTANGWFSRTDVVTTGSIYYDESERASSRTAARTLVDFTTGYDHGAWRFTVTATNLFDEAYYGLLIPGVGHGVPGAPRQIAATAAWRW